MKVLMALSGGVDSSVAAAELLDAGHDVVGITMRLWGGDSDTGCCSVADVDDARRVAQQLGIDHLVFNFTDDFHRHVVDPYVQAHRRGITPNPCIECNRHLKFDRLSERADLLGFDAVATGHHARIERFDGHWFVTRGRDTAKDQSYVVHMLPQRELARTLFPIGHLTKAEVRERAAALGLRTAAKPDSQDVCFITSNGGRTAFLGSRIPFRRATVVDAADGAVLGETDSVELVTLGQRRGVGLPGGGPKRYVVGIDVEAAVVTVGDESMLDVPATPVHSVTWAHLPVEGEVRVQCSAHGEARPATVTLDGGSASVEWQQPQRRVAPGQSVVFYDPTDTRVLGGGIAG
ncbi:MAG: tRNA-specific 2-thiouridylase MnmA [Actinomycetota bacterium]|jgi:tRNA-specific 2-thiouridylase